MPDDQGDKNKSPQPTPNLTGWVAIEGHTRGCDEIMIKDLDDDVDTLLVFAGLFSSVVTSFVLESYQWLEEDESQQTVDLLQRISQQLESFTLSSAFANSTVSAVPELSSFSPSSAVIIINILWFLSLVLSLAAALFGMMAKQWMREYMQWATLSGSSRDAVYLRQIRFEAWKRWKVMAIISAVPVLLEVSLILFLYGMILLLWTMNRLVAKVLTVAVCLILLLAFAFTILPAFRKHCPYKTPTGWACALIYDKLSYWLKGKPKGCRARFSAWKKRDMFIPAEEADLKAALSHRYELSQALETQVQVSALRRLLLWVRDDTQDDILLRNVAKCQDSLDRELSAKKVNNQLGTALASACKDVFLDLREVSQQITDHHVVVNLRNTLDQAAFESPISRSIPANSHQVLRAATIDSIETPAGVKFECLIQHLVTYLMFIAERPFHPSTRSKLPVQFVVGTLCFLYHSHNFSIFGNELLNFYNTNHDNSEMDQAYPGFRTFIFELLYRALGSRDRRGNGSIQLTLKMKRGITVSLSESIAQIACKIYDAGCQKIPELDRVVFVKEDRHLFVVASNLAIERWEKSELDDDETISCLFSKMLNIAQLSLERNWKNCGSYPMFTLPWISSLLSIVNSQKNAFKILTLMPSTLLELLRLGMDKNLIVGEESRTQLLELIQYHREANAPANFWEAIEAARRALPSAPPYDQAMDYFRFIEASNVIIQSKLWDDVLNDGRQKEALCNLLLRMADVTSYQLHYNWSSRQIYAGQLAWIDSLYKKKKLFVYRDFIALIPKHLLDGLQALCDTPQVVEPERELRRLHKLRNYWEKIRAHNPDTADFLEATGRLSAGDSGFAASPTLPAYGPPLTMVSSSPVSGPYHNANSWIAPPNSDGVSHPMQMARPSEATYSAPTPLYIPPTSNASPEFAGYLTRSPVSATAGDITSFPPLPRLPDDARTVGGEQQHLTHDASYSPVSQRNHFSRIGVSPQQESNTLVRGLFGFPVPTIPGVRVTLSPEHRRVSHNT